MSMPLHPGDPARVGGYELVRRLGQGGMGTVFLGRSPEGTQVAIKLVRPEFAGDAEFRGRFRSEVTRAQQVPPFSTAAVLDADPEHDPPYLVVEYVDGPALNSLVQERGPLSGPSLQSLAVGIATALTAIHGAGVIHRDLKPGNVLIAMGGIKVIDFGIARAFEATSKHTRTDQMVGTVAYMAPERFDSSYGKEVSSAADVFAWGAVVAYAATGRTPFRADSPAATAVRILTQPPDTEGVPQPLRSLVDASLAKYPEHRPTARELLDALLGSQTQRIAPVPLAVVPPLDDTAGLARHGGGGAGPARHEGGSAGHARHEGGSAGLARHESGGARHEGGSAGHARHEGGSAGHGRYESGSAGHARHESGGVEIGRADTGSGALTSSQQRPNRLRKPAVAGAAAAAVAVLLAGGLLGAHRASMADDSAAGAEPPAPPPPASVAPPAPTAVDTQAGILAGNRRFSIQLEQAGRFFMMDGSGSELDVSDGSGARSQFVLVPAGVDYMIKWLGREGYAGPDQCMGVRLAPGAAAPVISTACNPTEGTLFTLHETGEKDDKGRPVRSLRHTFGWLTWDADKKRSDVTEVGEPEWADRYTFVDRGEL